MANKKKPAKKINAEFPPRNRMFKREQAIRRATTADVIGRDPSIPVTAGHFGLIRRHD